MKTLSENGIEATLINPRFLSGLDEELLSRLENNHRLVVTLEDGIIDGGFGEKVARYYGYKPMNVKCYGLKKEFADCYDYEQLARKNRLKPELIAEDVISILRK